MSRREIEKFISDCKEKMKKIGWTYQDLAKACGMHKDSFSRILGPKKRNLAPSTAQKLAEALGVEVPHVGSFGGLSRGATLLADAKAASKMSLSEVEEKLGKAQNYFKLGAEELADIDKHIERVVNDIAERIRATSTLKRNLGVFLKH